MLFLILLCCHLIGAASAARALFTARSSQGAMAWVMAMITFPYLAVPLYWIFGRNRFEGYVASRRAGDRAPVDASANRSCTSRARTSLPLIR